MSFDLEISCLKMYRIHSKQHSVNIAGNSVKRALTECKPLPRQL